MAPKDAKVLVEVTDLESVFSNVRKGIKRMEIGGLNVSIRRMECFAVYGTGCVSCLRHKGNVILVEEWPNGQIHVDLYQKNPDGTKVLMNIDHVIPKSKGGKNDITNYQPMCQPCNSKKGNKIDQVAKEIESFIKAKIIYNMLFSGEFERWNEEVFMPHVRGDENCKSKGDVIKELDEMIQRQSKYNT